MSPGQGMPRGVVAQHGAVTIKCAQRVLEIDLDKIAVAGSDRPRAQHRDAADDVGCAEMEMDGQPVA